MLEQRIFTHANSSAGGWDDWHEAALRVPKEELSFFDGDKEVARARIYPEYHLQAPYENLPPGIYVNLDLLVVRADKRCSGIGLEVVKHVVNQYQGRRMIAFSAQDGFWASTGWLRTTIRNDERDRWPLYFT